MTRIFLTLALVANLALCVTFGMGCFIGDPRAPEVRSLVTLHFLVALGTAMLVLLVHAVALTYFMGTGRWIEETAAAYKLGDVPRMENLKLKSRVIPWMVGCMVLLIVTVAFGAMSDPASGRRYASAAPIHFSLAITTLLANFLVSWTEWSAIDRNGKIVNEVLAEVRAIRTAKGLEN